ncbi:MAG: alpha/beta hydrolase-fold protein [Bryobacteraceae bacterium]
MHNRPHSWALFLTAASFLFGGCRRMHKEPFEKVPLAPGEIQMARLSERPHLVVERLRFWSAELNEPRFFLALVPKAPPTSPRVFILNHGWFDRPEDLLVHLHVDAVLDGMIASGEIPPSMVVIPDVRFSNFFRQRSRRFPFANYLGLVAEDVASTVSDHFKVPFDRDRWGVGGFSFGGYLSLDVGRRYPGRFGAVAVISGFADSDWSFWPAAAPPPGPVDARGRGKHTVVVPGPPPRLLLACGTEDHLFPVMRLLHERLEEERFPHTWSTAPGGHTWEYWSSVLRPMLRFALGSDPEKERTQ